MNVEERYDPTIFRYGGTYSAQLDGRTFQRLFADGRTSTYAGYGQGTLQIARANRLTLGLRYTIDKRSVEATGERFFDNPPLVRPIPGLPLPSEQPLRANKTFRELTWRVSVDRTFSDEVMGYVSASRRDSKVGDGTSRRPKVRPSTRATQQF